MLIAWLAHLYTATGAVLAFLAARAVFLDDYRAAFSWLALQIVVDATDGALARRVQVSTRLPWFNGAKLDDITDYLTYVFVPALAVWKAALVPDGWTLVVVSAILLSSAYGFNRADAKTADHFFTGFPSYWNIVVFYLMVARWSGGANAGILMMFAALVFVPIRYIYPSRTVQWKAATIGLGVVWATLMVWMLWEYPDVSRPLFWASLAYPAYYFAVSIWLQFRSRPRDIIGQRGATHRRS
jgi:phosphatidylcholine synthase